MRHRIDPALRRVALLLLLCGCGGAGAQEGSASGDAADAAESPAAPARDPRQTVVLVDFSTSRPAEELQQSRRLTTDAVRSLSYGDRLVLLEVHRAGQDDAPAFVDTVARARSSAAPGRGDERRLAEHRERLERSLRVFFDSTRMGQIAGTDLFATLTSVAEHAVEAGGRPTRLLILSDMLHSTRELDMERGRVPDAAWIEQWAARGRIPRLDGVCVGVVGPDVSTDQGVRLREFWKRYFQAAGATLKDENYRNAATQTDSFDCT